MAVAVAAGAARPIPRLAALRQPGSPGHGRLGAGGGPDAQAALAALGQGVNAETPLPNISAKGGLSALHHAVRQGYLGTTKALLDAGALLNEKSGDGHTPLLVALINGQFDVAMELISRGANVNTSSDSHGVTPLWADRQRALAAAHAIPAAAGDGRPEGRLSDGDAGADRQGRGRQRPHSRAPLVHGLHRLRQRQLRTVEFRGVHGVLARVLWH